MKDRLVWVGPKESDTLYSGLDFFRSVTFNGSNSAGNTSLTSIINTRIDHISDGSKWHLSNKANMRAFAQECIPVVPYVHFTGKNIPSVRFMNMENDSFILQTVQSSSGAGTHQLSLKECQEYVASHSESEEYILSPYLKHAVSVNVHIVVFDRHCIVLPSSFQLISHQDQDFRYIGADFHTDLSHEQSGLISNRAYTLGEKLRETLI